MTAAAHTTDSAGGVVSGRPEGAASGRPDAAESGVNRRFHPSIRMFPSNGTLLFARGKMPLARLIGHFARFMFTTVGFFAIL
ncbi:MAG: hypothetical protein KM312_06190 [Hydrogenibacillus schlegelii]|uniref:Uncharacterized protein n=1 Tax=Hydrogenibacillus schlegelii TaxID=1484 RepID=A0A947G846_HYDSH|nr:hypothetical protein [Hydrogenibacillus schlegelii]